MPEPDLRGCFLERALRLRQASHGGHALQVFKVPEELEPPLVRAVGGRAHEIFRSAPAPRRAAARDLPTAVGGRRA